MQVDSGNRARVASTQAQQEGATGPARPRTLRIRLALDAHVPFSFGEYAVLSELAYHAEHPHFRLAMGWPLLVEPIVPNSQALMARMLRSPTLAYQIPTFAVCAKLLKDRIDKEESQMTGIEGVNVASDELSRKRDPYFFPPQIAHDLVDLADLANVYQASFEVCQAFLRSFSPTGSRRVHRDEPELSQHPLHRSRELEQIQVAFDLLLRADEGTKPAMVTALADEIFALAKRFQITIMFYEQVHTSVHAEFAKLASKVDDIDAQLALVWKVPIHALHVALTVIATAKMQPMRNNTEEIQAAKRVVQFRTSELIHILEAWSSARATLSDGFHAKLFLRKFRGEYHWNEGFQAAFALPETTREEALHKYRTLSGLASDFVNEASAYGKTIITELSRRAESRTINTQQQFQGVLGGHKYVVNGILFKLALDREGRPKQFVIGVNKPMYEFAAKTAGHDFTGAVHFYNLASASSLNFHNYTVKDTASLAKPSTKTAQMNRSNSNPSAQSYCTCVNPKPCAPQSAHPASPPPLRSQNSNLQSRSLGELRTLGRRALRLAGIRSRTWTGEGLPMSRQVYWYLWQSEARRLQFAKLLLFPWYREGSRLLSPGVVHGTRLRHSRHSVLSLTRARIPNLEMQEASLQSPQSPVSPPMSPKERSTISFIFINANLSTRQRARANRNPLRARRTHPRRIRLNSTLSLRAAYSMKPARSIGRTPTAMDAANRRSSNPTQSPQAVDHLAIPNSVPVTPPPHTSTMFGTANGSTNLGIPQASSTNPIASTPIHPMRGSNSQAKRILSIFLNSKTHGKRRNTPGEPGITLLQHYRALRKLRRQFMNHRDPRQKTAFSTLVVTARSPSPPSGGCSEPGASPSSKFVDPTLEENRPSQCSICFKPLRLNLPTTTASATRPPSGIRTFPSQERLFEQSRRRYQQQLEAEAENVELTLRVPMQVLIDYKGFRLLAMPLLPIDKDTIIYGSHDAGGKIFASDHEFNLQMANCAAALHLKGHYVVPGTKDQPPQPVLLHTAVDTEGHKGKDNNFYLLDLSRTFPAQSPSHFISHLPFQVRSTIYFRLFRPEFLMALRTQAGQPGCAAIRPLSSDALSPWDHDDEYEGEYSIIATTMLLFSAIPAFAAELSRFGVHPDLLPLVDHDEMAFNRRVYNARLRYHELKKANLATLEKEVVQLTWQPDSSLNTESNVASDAGRYALQKCASHVYPFETNPASILRQQSGGRSADEGFLYIKLLAVGFPTDGTTDPVLASTDQENLSSNGRGNLREELDSASPRRPTTSDPRDQAVEATQTSHGGLTLDYQSLPSHHPYFIVRAPVGALPKIHAAALLGKRPADLRSVNSDDDLKPSSGRDQQDLLGPALPEPLAASYFDALGFAKQEYVTQLTGLRLNREFHKRGINMRHAGLVRWHVHPASPLSKAILVDMVQRTLKNLMRRLLRAETTNEMNEMEEENGQDSLNLHAQGSHARVSDWRTRRRVVAFLNLVSGSSQNSQLFWTENVFPELVFRYGHVAMHCKFPPLRTYFPVGPRAAARKDDKGTNITIPSPFFDWIKNREALYLATQQAAAHCAARLANNRRFSRVTLSASELATLDESRDPSALNMSCEFSPVPAHYSSDQRFLSGVQLSGSPLQPVCHRDSDYDDFSLLRQASTASISALNMTVSSLARTQSGYLPGSTPTLSTPARSIVPDTPYSRYNQDAQAPPLAAFRRISHARPLAATKTEHEWIWTPDGICPLSLYFSEYLPRIRAEHQRHVQLLNYTMSRFDTIVSMIQAKNPGETCTAPKPSPSSSSSTQDELQDRLKDPNVPHIFTTQPPSALPPPYNMGFVQIRDGVELLEAVADSLETIVNYVLMRTGLSLSPDCAAAFAANPRSFYFSVTDIQDSDAYVKRLPALDYFAGKVGCLEAQDPRMDASARLRTLHKAHAAFERARLSDPLNEASCHEAALCKFLILEQSGLPAQADMTMIERIQDVYTRCLGVNFKHLQPMNHALDLKTALSSRAQSGTDEALITPFTSRSHLLTTQRACNMTLVTLITLLETWSERRRVIQLYSHSGGASAWQIFLWVYHFARSFLAALSRSGLGDNVLKDKILAALESSLAERHRAVRHTLSSIFDHTRVCTLQAYPRLFVEFARERLISACQKVLEHYLRLHQVVDLPTAHNEAFEGSNIESIARRLLATVASNASDQHGGRSVVLWSNATSRDRIVKLIRNASERLVSQISPKDMISLIQRRLPTWDAIDQNAERYVRAHIVSAILREMLSSLNPQRKSGGSLWRDIETIYATQSKEMDHAVRQWIDAMESFVLHELGIPVITESDAKRDEKNQPNKFQAQALLQGLEAFRTKPPSSQLITPPSSRAGPEFLQPLKAPDVRLNGNSYGDVIYEVEVEYFNPYGKEQSLSGPSVQVPNLPQQGVPPPLARMAHNNSYARRELNESLGVMPRLTNLARSKELHSEIVKQSLFLLPPKATSHRVSESMPIAARGSLAHESQQPARPAPQRLPIISQQEYNLQQAWLAKPPTFVEVLARTRPDLMSRLRLSSVRRGVDDHAFPTKEPASESMLSTVTRDADGNPLLEVVSQFKQTVELASEVDVSAALFRLQTRHALSKRVPSTLNIASDFPALGQYFILSRPPLGVGAAPIAFLTTAATLISTENSIWLSSTTMATPSMKHPGVIGYLSASHATALRNGIAEQAKNLIRTHMSLNFIRESKRRDNTISIPSSVVVQGHTIASVRAAAASTLLVAERVGFLPSQAFLSRQMPPWSATSTVAPVFASHLVAELAEESLGSSFPFGTYHIDARRFRSSAIDQLQTRIKLALSKYHATGRVEKQGLENSTNPEREGPQDFRLVPPSLTPARVRQYAEVYHLALDEAVRTCDYAMLSILRDLGVTHSITGIPSLSLALDWCHRTVMREEAELKAKLREYRSQESSDDRLSISDLEGQLSALHEQPAALVRELIRDYSISGHIDARDQLGRTPLMYASERGDYAAVLALLNAGANPNAQADDGSTPLHYVVNRAGIRKSLAILRALKKYLVTQATKKPFRAKRRADPNDPSKKSSAEEKHHSEVPQGDEDVQASTADSFISTTPTKALATDEAVEDKSMGDIRGQHDETSSPAVGPDGNLGILLDDVDGANVIIDDLTTDPTCTSFLITDVSSEVDFTVSDTLSDTLEIGRSHLQDSWRDLRLLYESDAEASPKTAGLHNSNDLTVTRRRSLESSNARSLFAADSSTEYDSEFEADDECEVNFDSYDEEESDKAGESQGERRSDIGYYDSDARVVYRKNAFTWRLRHASVRNQRRRQYVSRAPSPPTTMTSSRSPHGSPSSQIPVDSVGTLARLDSQMPPKSLSSDQLRPAKQPSASVSTTEIPMSQADALEELSYSVAAEDILCTLHEFDQTAESDASESSLSEEDCYTEDEAMEKMVKYINESKIEKATRVAAQQPTQQQSGQTFNNPEDPELDTLILVETSMASALQSRAFCRYLRTLRVLLEYKADPNLAARNNITPLHRACKYGLPASVAELLNAGADALAPTSPDQFTPLMFACASADPASNDVISLLLRHPRAPGSNMQLQQVDSEGRTPLQHALKPRPSMLLQASTVCSIMSSVQRECFVRTRRSFPQGTSDEEIQNNELYKLNLAATYASLAAVARDHLLRSHTPSTMLNDSMLSGATVGLVASGVLTQHALRESAVEEMLSCMLAAMLENYPIVSTSFVSNYEYSAAMESVLSHVPEEALANAGMSGMSSLAIVVRGHAPQGQPKATASERHDTEQLFSSGSSIEIAPRPEHSLLPVGIPWEAAASLSESIPATALPLFAAAPMVSAAFAASTLSSSPAAIAGTFAWALGRTEQIKARASEGNDSISTYSTVFELTGSGVLLPRVRPATWITLNGPPRDGIKSSNSQTDALLSSMNVAASEFGISLSHASLNPSVVGALASLFYSAERERKEGLETGMVSQDVDWATPHAKTKHQIDPNQTQAQSSETELLFSPLESHIGIDLTSGRFAHEFFQSVLEALESEEEARSNPIQAPAPVAKALMTLGVRAGSNMVSSLGANVLLQASLNLAHSFLAPWARQLHSQVNAEILAAGVAAYISAARALPCAANAVAASANMAYQAALRDHDRFKNARMKDMPSIDRVGSRDSTASREEKVSQSSGQLNAVRAGRDEKPSATSALPEGYVAGYVAGFVGERGVAPPPDVATLISEAGLDPPSLARAAAAAVGASALLRLAALLLTQYVTFENDDQRPPHVVKLISLQRRACGQVAQLISNLSRAVSSRVDKFGASAFHYAAVLGDGDLLQNMAEARGVDLATLATLTDKFQNSALLYSCAAGNQALLATLQASKQEVQVHQHRNALDQSPQMVAAGFGQIKLIRMLKDKSITYLDRSGLATLHYAAFHHSVLRQVVSSMNASQPKLAHVHSGSDDGRRTVLAIAAANGSAPVIEYMLQTAGGYVHTADAFGRSTLQLVISSSNYDAIRHVVKYIGVSTGNARELKCNYYTDWLKYLLRACVEVGAPSQIVGLIRNMLLRHYIVDPNQQALSAYYSEPSDITSLLLRRYASVGDVPWARTLIRGSRPGKHSHPTQLTVALLPLSSITPQRNLLRNSAKKKSHSKNREWRLLRSRVHRFGAYVYPVHIERILESLSSLICPHPPEPCGAIGAATRSSLETDSLWTNFLEPQPPTRQASAPVPSLSSSHSSEMFDFFIPPQNSSYPSQPSLDRRLSLSGLQNQSQMEVTYESLETHPGGDNPINGATSSEGSTVIHTIDGPLQQAASQCATLLYSWLNVASGTAQLRHLPSLSKQMSSNSAMMPDSSPSFGHQSSGASRAVSIQSLLLTMPSSSAFGTGPTARQPSAQSLIDGQAVENRSNVDASLGDQPAHHKPEVKKKRPKAAPLPWQQRPHQGTFNTSDKFKEFMKRLILQVERASIVKEKKEEILSRLRSCVNITISHSSLKAKWNTLVKELNNIMKPQTIEEGDESDLREDDDAGNSEESKSQTASQSSKGKERRSVMPSQASQKKKNPKSSSSRRSSKESTAPNDENNNDGKDMRIDRENEYGSARPGRRRQHRKKALKSSLAGLHDSKDDVELTEDNQELEETPGVEAEEGPRVTWEQCLKEGEQSTPIENPRPDSIPESSPGLNESINDSIGSESNLSGIGSFNLTSESKDAMKVEKRLPILVPSDCNELELTFENLLEPERKDSTKIALVGPMAPQPIDLAIKQTNVEEGRDTVTNASTQDAAVKSELLPLEYIMHKNYGTEEDVQYVCSQPPLLLEIEVNQGGKQMRKLGTSKKAPEQRTPTKLTVDPFAYRDHAWKTALMYAVEFADSVATFDTVMACFQQFYASGGHTMIDPMPASLYGIRVLDKVKMRAPEEVVHEFHLGKYSESSTKPDTEFIRAVLSIPPKELTLTALFPPSEFASTGELSALFGLTASRILASLLEKGLSLSVLKDVGASLSMSSSTMQSMQSALSAPAFHATSQDQRRVCIHSAEHSCDRFCTDPDLSGKVEAYEETQLRTRDKITEALRTMFYESSLEPPADMGIILPPRPSPLCIATLTRYHLENVRDRAGNSCLHLAARSGLVPMFEKLVLDYNLSLMVRNARGETPLHVAIIYGHSQIVRFIAKLAVAWSRSSELDLTSNGEAIGFVPRDSGILAAMNPRQVSICESAKVDTRAKSKIEAAKAGSNEPQVHLQPFGWPNNEVLEVTWRLATFAEIALAIQHSMNFARGQAGELKDSKDIKDSKDSKEFKEVKEAKEAKMDLSNEGGLSTQPVASSYENAGSTEEATASAATTSGSTSALAKPARKARRSKEEADMPQKTHIHEVQRDKLTSFVELLLELDLNNSGSANDVQPTPSLGRNLISSSGTQGSSNYENLKIRQELPAILYTYSAREVLNAIDENELTPLTLAAKHCHSEIVSILLETGLVNIEARDKYGGTPFSNAARSNCTEVMDLLIAHNADVNSRSSKGLTPFLQAVNSAAYEAVVRLMKDPRTHINAVDNTGRTAFHIAAREKQKTHIIKILKVLLASPQMRDQIDTPDSNGKSPLHIALMESNQKAAKLLIDAKADVITHQDEYLNLSRRMPEIHNLIKIKKHTR